MDSACSLLFVVLQPALRPLLLNAGFTNTILAEVARGSVRSTRGGSSTSTASTPLRAGSSSGRPALSRATSATAIALRAKSRPGSAATLGNQDTSSVTAACVRGVETVLQMGGMQEVIGLNGATLLVDLAHSGRNGYAEALECLVVIAASEVRGLGGARVCVAWELNGCRTLHVRGGHSMFTPGTR